jgi:ABC-type Fe3+/spermidine/putrescine transport system ATPase subunit
VDAGKEIDTMSSSRFEFRSVTKTYEGRDVLAAVSISLAAGEHTALLGLSGSGKTTALRLLAGFEAPDGGEVVLNGNVVSAPKRIVLPAHRRGIALVFQDLALWPNLSVRDNVLLGLAGLDLARSEARARADEALALCGIEELAGRKPGRISGGQQQRVALARAVAFRPAFLLLDEPFAGLDLVLKARLLEEIASLVARQSLTVLLVTHDPFEALALCRSAVVLDHGRVAEAGILTDLLRTPRSDLLRVFREHLQRTGMFSPVPKEADSDGRLTPPT